MHAIPSPSVPPFLPATQAVRPTVAVHAASPLKEKWDISVFGPSECNRSASQPIRIARWRKAAAVACYGPIWGCFPHPAAASPRSSPPLIAEQSNRSDLPQLINKEQVQALEVRRRSMHASASHAQPLPPRSPLLPLN